MKNSRHISLGLLTVLALIATQASLTRHSISANSETKASANTALEDPCGALTPVAIKNVINAIKQSRDVADRDAAANGSAGAYASAARDNAANLATAYDKMVSLQTWLATENLGSPHVTNATAAYNVHGYTRDAIGSLYQARHWATVSAANHRSNDARSSFDLTTNAITLAEGLGANAGRCYMSGYFR
jgi:hypothetical protein